MFSSALQVSIAVATVTDFSDQASLLQASGSVNHRALEEKATPIVLCQPVGAKDDSNPAGTNDLAGYQKVMKAFVGINAKTSEGSGFVMGGANALNHNDFGKMPDSNTGRNNLCTCDCVAGHDGIGCSGWGGIRFRYNSMLWTDPFTHAWTGQMEAWQPKDESEEGTFGTEFHFIGNDVRRYPGGPAIYNVACTQGECSLFSGTFRQSNGPVQCSVALAEEESSESTSCYNRCVTKGKSQLYEDWLNYCKADKEDTTSGFSGYGK